MDDHYIQLDLNDRFQTYICNSVGVQDYHYAQAIVKKIEANIRKYLFMTKGKK